jgi:hypothetical protein
MEFEELQVIWNTQDLQPLYMINEMAVQAAMWRQRQASRRSWFRWNIVTGCVAAGMSVIAGLLVLRLFGDPARFTWQVNARLVVAGALLLCFVAILANAWLKEKQREGPFSGSLREELDRSIAHIEYQIRSGGGRTACMMAIPLFVGVSLVLWALDDVNVIGSSPQLLVVLVLVMLSGFPVEIWRHHRRVTRDLLPRMHALESLRAKLANTSS